jgi:hypothetical protein
MNDLLLETAQRAYETTRFYRRLYGALPTRTADVPFINDSSFFRAGGLIDCITDPTAMIWALMPFHRHGRRFPFSVVEDEYDQESRQFRMARAMAHVGIPVDRRDLRFLLIADEVCGPFACELCKGIAWEHHQASITYWTGDPETLNAALDAYQPDWLVQVCDAIPERHWQAAARHSGAIRVARVEGLLEEKALASAWLFSDQLGVLGARRAGDLEWDMDPERILIETHPHSGLSHATTLDFSLFPFIRYGLGQVLPVRGPTSGEDAP